MWDKFIASLSSFLCYTVTRLSVTTDGFALVIDLIALQTARDYTLQITITH
jgi:hypothetical protein